MKGYDHGEDSWIWSAGLDIGTSTTKLIVSRLKYMRTSSSLSLPRYEIVERVLVHASPIFTTPLSGPDEIDAERIWDIVASEYGKALIRPQDIKSGAVIITGETATKHNAAQIVHMLAERAGDFVVATAGADLEGLLAGKGAGADQLSRETKQIVANIDIGGGTANVVWFQRGKPIGTVTFHVGGRLMRLDEDGRLLGVSPSIEPWLRKRGYRLQCGDIVGFSLLRDVCAAMCGEMLDYVSGRMPAEECPALQELALGTLPARVPHIGHWMFSGGIGHMMNDEAPNGLSETVVHGDMGPLLAGMLKASVQRYPIRLAQPAQTVRATVIGAGMQSTEMSGATIHLDERLLPMRNVPVLQVELSPNLLEDEAMLSDAIVECMKVGAGLYDPVASPPFALALSGVTPVTYDGVQRLSKVLSEQFKHYFPESGAMVVVCEQDAAKALGQALERRCAGWPSIVCIDQVRVEHGDYIDFGEPISGRMIPVVVKTLAFHSSSMKEGHMT